MKVRPVVFISINQNNCQKNTQNYKRAMDQSQVDTSFPSDSQDRYLRQADQSTQLLGQNDIPLQSEESSIHDDSIFIGEIVNQSYRNIFKKSILEPYSSHQFDSAYKDLETNRILSCRFDPSTTFVASGCEDGVLRIVSIATNNLAFTLVDPAEKYSPATCVRWRPTYPMENIKYSLLATYSNGSVLYWHATSNQVLIRTKEEDNQVYACDYSCDGLRFVTGGTDTKIRLYDAGRARPVAAHTESSSAAPKHNNRIFAIRSHKTEPFVVYSAGWDNTVLIWDMRVRQAQQYIYGTLVCGDALDQVGNTLLTGSWRDENQIETWDLRQLKKVASVKWDNFASPQVSEQIPRHQRQRTSVYAACFDKSGKYIYAASAGTVYSEIRLFDTNDNYKCLDAYSMFKRGILSLDCVGQYIAYGVADGTQGIMEIK